MRLCFLLMLFNLWLQTAELLWAAASSGDAKTVSEMDAAKMQKIIDFVDADGHTALMRACHNGHAAVVEVLLRSRADLDKTTTAGKTALSIAADQGHYDVCKLLVSKLRWHFSAGKALSSAACAGQLELIRLLLSVDSDAQPSVPSLLDALKWATEEAASLLLQVCLSFISFVLSLICTFAELSSFGGVDWRFWDR